MVLRWSTKGVFTECLKCSDIIPGEHPAFNLVMYVTSLDTEIRLSIILYWGPYTLTASPAPSLHPDTTIINSLFKVAFLPCIFRLGEGVFFRPRRVDNCRKTLIWPKLWFHRYSWTRFKNNEQTIHIQVLITDLAISVGEICRTRNKNKRIIHWLPEHHVGTDIFTCVGVTRHVSMYNFYIIVTENTVMNARYIVHSFLT